MESKKNSKITAKNSDYRKLYKSALKFLDPLETQETYKKIVQEAAKLVGSNYASLFLKEKTGLKRVSATSKALYKNKISKNGYTFRAFLKNKPSSVSSRQIEKRHPAIRDMGIKSTIYVPLINKKKHLGLISVDFFSDGDYSNEMEVLNLFSTYATMAIRKTQLYSQLKETIEERDLFVSLAAHEIRTPLTILILYSDLLVKLASEDREKAQKWAKIIYRESRLLKQLTDELLSVDSIKNNQLQFDFSQENLTSILNLSVFQFSSINRQRITFNPPKENIEIIADKAKLMQVFMNVLNNAAKYSPQNKPIEIEMNIKEKNAIIKFKDHGIGIKKENLTKVFNKYTSFSSNKSGLGLGLYLSKNIIEMHRGKIGIRSKPQQGTTIIITLPLKSNTRPASNYENRSLYRSI